MITMGLIAEKTRRAGRSWRWLIGNHLVCRARALNQKSTFDFFVDHLLLTIRLYENRKNNEPTNESMLVPWTNPRLGLAINISFKVYCLQLTKLYIFNTVSVGSEECLSRQNRLVGFYVPFLVVIFCGI